MFNFKPSSWNKINSVERAKILNRGVGGSDDGYGISYFFHNSQQLTDVISAYAQSIKEPGFRGFLKDFFGEDLVSKKMVEEKVKQGFAPTTLEVKIDNGKFSFPNLSLNQIDLLKKEIKNSKLGFILAQGYGKRIYKLKNSDEKLTCEILNLD